MRLIDADALKKAIGDLYGLTFEEMTELSKTYGMEDLWDTSGVLNAIDNAPTVEQKYYERIIAQINPVIEERPQGEWIARNDETHYCSNCRGDAIDGDFDEIITAFCPHCGAEMKGGAE